MSHVWNRRHARKKQFGKSADPDRAAQGHFSSACLPVVMGKGKGPGYQKACFPVALPGKLWQKPSALETRIQWHPEAKTIGSGTWGGPIPHYRSHKVSRVSLQVYIVVTFTAPKVSTCMASKISKGITAHYSYRTLVGFRSCWDLSQLHQFSIHFFCRDFQRFADDPLPAGQPWTPLVLGW